ncbi:hypothetical protein L3081_20005 [Colwellia sp. MSW7]|uniref:Uncharacterized protein n=1 Tax=Colwellia maritima TaxID=2912588 RepID=A0ABS9X858_9GAMM|nr:hypothetical protein [Colwellia maritima]MCI2285242.1 hypothetical protein [Colwellia maritima]
MMSQLMRVITTVFTLIKASCFDKKRAMLWTMLCLFSSSSVFAIYGPAIYVGLVPNLWDKTWLCDGTLCGA